MLSVNTFLVKFLNEVHLSIFCLVKKLCYTMCMYVVNLKHGNFFTKIFMKIF